MDLTVGLAGSGADRIIVGTAEDEINQALAEVGAAGGGSVTLLQGTYSLASGILIDRDNITLKGAGAGQTVLQALPAYPVATPLIQISAVDNFTVQDITVDGHTNEAEANPIMAFDCTNGVIAGCEVLLSENHNYGIWIVKSSDIQVLDNRIDGVTPADGQEGIETWSSDNVLISGNTIVNIGNTGINVGSATTPDVGDIEGHNTNIRVVDNIIDNTLFGISIGVAGPRSFGQIQIEGNTLTNIYYGVRLFSVDRAAGAPDSESATVDHPQSLHDIDISNNDIDLIPSPWSTGIVLQNDSSLGAVSFSNIEASDNVFSNAAQEIGAIGYAQFILAGTAQGVNGSSDNDAIIGSDLANVLSGGGGTDVMWGGRGDDAYYVDSADDFVFENANEGSDTVFATSSYTLSANLEMLTLAYGSGIQAIGNAGDNWIWGNGLDNVIDGGGGMDVMAGGLGDDTYYVDSSNDVTGENANEGTDTVFAAVSYTLGANVERLSLANGTGIRATGNAGDNWIWGNGLDNVLDGGGGSDTVDYSSATQAVVVDLPGHIALGAQIGTDTIWGMENVRTGSGNDRVAGDGATNVLDGGDGIDLVSYYLVTSGVVLDLAAGVGVDGTSTDTLLNFENANGTGFNDAISGTAAANVLNGLGGIDTISYYTSSQGVTIDLATGIGLSDGVTDTLLNFENANGSGNADVIMGNGGANVLNGLGGADTLTGGDGFDVFEFWAGQADGDVITDFTGNGTSSGDEIRLAGFGTAAQGATFTQIDATQWQIHSGLDGHDEIVTLSNGGSVHGSDFFFV